MRAPRTTWPPEKASLNPSADASALARTVTVDKVLDSASLLGPGACCAQLGLDASAANMIVVCRRTPERWDEVGKRVVLNMDEMHLETTPVYRPAPPRVALVRRTTPRQLWCVAVITGAVGIPHGFIAGTGWLPMRAHGWLAVNDAEATPFIL
jgi:hypothetical protein